MMFVNYSKKISLVPLGTGVSQKRSFINGTLQTGLDVFNPGVSVPPVVNYPRSNAGKGKHAWLKAMGNGVNAIVFYNGHFFRSNVTPFTLRHLVRTSRRRLFYISHYVSQTSWEQTFTVQLFWPV